MATPWDRPTRTSDVAPPGPNLIGLAVGFGYFCAAPTVCLHSLAAIWEDAIGDDQVASLFMLMPWEENFAVAAVLAALFLVVGLILQALQLRRPFPTRWPALLAFPLAWALIVPETVARGGSAASGAVVATAVALGFAVQWGSVMILRETME